MTTNAECVVAVIADHRASGGWTDEAFMADLLAQLGLDPAGKAAKAKPVVVPGITEEEVAAHEAAAKEAVAKAEASRAALKAQREDAAHLDAAATAKTNLVGRQATAPSVPRA